MKKIDLSRNLALSVTKELENGNQVITIENMRNIVKNLMQDKGNDEKIVYNSKKYDDIGLVDNQTKSLKLFNTKKDSSSNEIGSPDFIDFKEFEKKVSLILKRKDINEKYIKENIESLKNGSLDNEVPTLDYKYLISHLKGFHQSGGNINEYRTEIYTILNKNKDLFNLRTDIDPNLDLYEFIEISQAIKYIEKKINECINNNNPDGYILNNLIRYVEILEETLKKYPYFKTNISKYKEQIPVIENKINKRAIGIFN